VDSQFPDAWNSINDMGGQYSNGRTNDKYGNKKDKVKKGI
jgi:hypothetical protein